MQESITALVVHQNSETLASLKSALERQGMCIIQAESRAQANRMLGGQSPAPLVFTETQLPDGTWPTSWLTPEGCSARKCDRGGSSRRHAILLEAIETAPSIFSHHPLLPRISHTWSGALSTMSSLDAAPAFLSQTLRRRVVVTYPEAGNTRRQGDKSWNWEFTALRMSNGIRIAAPRSTADAMRNLREAIALADAVGSTSSVSANTTRLRCRPPRAR